jgi:hypothetical protein
MTVSTIFSESASESQVKQAAVSSESTALQSSLLSSSVHQVKSYDLSTINIILNLSTMSRSDSSTDERPLTPPSVPALGVIPRAGQPGAMQFDSKNITEFLEEWNIECENFGVDKVKRCARFPNYCARGMKNTSKLLPGYIAGDWDVLQTDVKKLYWPHDKLKNTMTALDEAHTLDLNISVLKYTSISEALVTAHALSTLERVTRLLDGLLDDLRRKHCTKKLST